MKKSVITIMLSFIATVMMAQKTVVTGVLVDATLQEGEPYATVRIFKKGAQKPAAMCVTDLDGHFSQEIAGNGNYVVQMSSIGKVDTNREITLSGQTEIDLGHVEMKEDAQMLAGVEVVAQKPLVKMEVDKMSYNVQDDADSKAATVLDMLRKVPMVTVDGEDNISVNGSSSFKVYVDGKPNVMMSSAPSQVFKAMPASMVKNIEVITNPGAKYDAEGGAGVLNIVMNKEATAAMGGASSMNGYNGNIRVQAGTKSLGASAFVSGQQDKLTYSANVNYNQSNPGETTTTMEREQLGTMPSTLISESTSKPKTPFVMGNITLGYELDALSSIGLTAGITSFNMKSNSHSTNSYTGSMYGNGYSYGNTIDTKMKRTSFSGSLDYQRFFNQERTSSLTLAYQLTYAPTNNETTTLFDQLENNSWMDMTDRYSENKERTTDHIFQADFTTLLGTNTTLNAGMKFSYRKATSDADNYLMGEYSEALSSEYEYKNAILAGYTEFVSKFGKWSTKAGLRYEQTWQDVSYQLGNGNDFTTNYAPPPAPGPPRCPPN